jgi:hypothetical protein
MNYYMLLLRSEKIDFGSYSPEDFQKIVSEFDEWNSRMTGKDQLVASGNLPTNKGKVLRSGGNVSDGPYSETKEAVTGFFLIRAGNDQEAAELAGGCPFLPRGGSVELRPVPELAFEAIAESIVDEQRNRRGVRGKKGGA